jgi:hypothetical protein
MKKFEPWLYIEDFGTGPDIDTESKKTWFRSACKGWRIVPENIHSYPFGKDMEKIACTLVASIYDDKGRKMASFPHSGIYSQKNSENDNPYDQNFLSTMFDIAVDEALSSLGFTAFSAMRMKEAYDEAGKGKTGQKEAAGNTEQKTMRGPVQTVQVQERAVSANEDKNPESDLQGRKDRINMLLDLAHKHKCLKNITDANAFAAMVTGKSLSEENVQEVEDNMKEFLSDIKKSGNKK